MWEYLIGIAGAAAVYKVGVTIGRDQMRKVIESKVKSRYETYLACWSNRNVEGAEDAENTVARINTVGLEGKVHGAGEALASVAGGEINPFGEHEVTRANTNSELISGEARGPGITLPTTPSFGAHPKE
ncbi:hypothetical protein CMO91_05805 [Candidatus Woesearchaeota archaeon]|nr:hypothetical protein [Candidatus Woesearchaeota archaeon]